MKPKEPILPHDLDAERSVLGAILIENSAYAAVAPILSPKHFYRQAHRAIAKAIWQRCDQNDAVDITIICSDLETAGVLDDVGGPAYVASLVDGVPRSTNAKAYAEIVREKAQLVTLVNVSKALGEKAYSGGEPSKDIARWCEAKLFDAVVNGAGSGMVSVSSAARELVGKLEARAALKGAMTGLDTGLSELNRETRGWQPGELIVMGARPSIGKTSLAMHCATAAGRAYHRVAVFSLEMRREQLEDRLVSSLSGVPLTAILDATSLTAYDWTQIAAAGELLSEMPIEIDDTPSRSVLDVRAICRQMKADGGLDLVIIDYAQLMEGAVVRKDARRDEEISHASRRLKIMAGELRVPVILLSQLSRQSEQRADPRPKLSDLRESGALEQDADTVCLLHRSDHREGGKTECILAKQRNGATGTVNLYLQRETVTFRDWTDADAASEPQPEAKPKRAAPKFAWGKRR